MLSIRDGYAYLQDVSGREMGKTPCKEALLPGSQLSVAGKEVEIDEVITREYYLAGKPFLKNSSKQIPSQQPQASKVITIPDSPVGKKVKMEAVKDVAPSGIAPKSFYAPLPSARFKNPMLAKTVVPQSIPGIPTPRHDPKIPGALVMKRPSAITCPKGKQIVDVVLDPFLGQHVREHQREGIKFMYECVMGLRGYDGQGALLADAMGLGKTFMTIALIWTLLKQNPIHGNPAVIKKALIVCPVTLIRNWKKEFKKWLGTERIGVFVADGNKIRITDFTHGRSYSVMIIGYEKLRSVQDELKKGAEIDLVICDEGHRLKTDGNKSAQAIKSLNTARRIILSGTPLQNDLGELYVMVDFVNPGILGTYKTFKKEFEVPIMASRNPEATAKEKEKGEARQAELATLTKQFVLRREADVLNKYLPPKTEYVLFCKPTQAQAEVYQHVLSSPVFGSVLGSPEASLQLITILKKVCNSPTLLSKSSDAIPSNGNVAKLMESIPSSLIKSSNYTASTKIRVLDGMLRALSRNTSEKIVLVSNYTSTLDMLAQHLTSLSLSYLRLDGSTPSSKRQDLVDAFNKTSATKNFAFLLSAKSGGAGINLIGASRLVLFDVDWNPATDLQAMARIHRDGQKRPVMIYRFLMAGGMDEKIYQRQITKMGLADSVMDGKKNESSFSAADLRDLFRLELQAGCQTHELLGCTCDGSVFSHNGQSCLPGEEEETIEIDNGSDSDEDLPENPAMPIPASRYDWKATEQKVIDDANEKRKKNSKGKMQALMQYSHIDTSIFAQEVKNLINSANYDMDGVKSAKELLDDDVLTSMFEENKCKINYIFMKRG